LRKREEGYKHQLGVKDGVFGTLLPSRLGTKEECKRGDSNSMFLGGGLLKKQIISCEIFKVNIAQNPKGQICRNATLIIVRGILSEKGKT